MSPQQWNEERWEEIEPGVRRRRTSEVIVEAPEAGDGVEIEATEAAIRLASENNVDLSTVEATGSGGRITVDDVRAAISKAEADAASEAARTLAESEGLNIEEIEGTGADGRVVLGDVEAAVAARDAAEESGEPPSE